MGIRHFSYNFPKIYSKRRVSELHSAAKSSKLSGVNKRQAMSSLAHASEAISASQAQSCKSSKSSMVRASEATFVSEQAKRSLRKPAKAKQANKLRKPAKANQASKKTSLPTSKSSISSKPSSSHTRVSKLNIRNSTKRRRKASFG